MAARAASASFPILRELDCSADGRSDRPLRSILPAQAAIPNRGPLQENKRQGKMDKNCF